MIAVGVQDKNLYVVVTGKGTAEYCSELNACFQGVLDKIEIEHVYFDTSEATYLDSSFIGLILSIKKKKSVKHGMVALLNPSDKIVEIFQLMGLDSFVPSIYDKDMYCKNCDVEINKKLENSIADIKLLLDSHRNIMETSTENHKRFMLVEKVFQKELEQRHFTN